MDSATERSTAPEAISTSSPRRVHPSMGSELVCKQLNGQYRVKHPGLQPLAARARVLVGQLDDVTFQHVRREQNKEADRLSNLGMDEAEAALKAEKEARSAGSGAQPQRNLF